MKTKFFALFVALVATNALWASNVITYNATEKPKDATDEITFLGGYTISIDNAGFHPKAFNVAVTSHEFANGKGKITFDGEVTTIGEWAFASCKSLTSITIPNSVKTIGEEAFAGCTGLKSITIPNSVTTIDWGAFSWCEGLTSITCYAKTPPTCGDYVFSDINKNINVYVPASALADYQEAYGWGDLQLFPLK